MVGPRSTQCRSARRGDTEPALTPSGDSARQGPITRAGSAHVPRRLVEDRVEQPAPTAVSYEFRRQNPRVPRPHWRGHQGSASAVPTDRRARQAAQQIRRRDGDARSPSNCPLARPRAERSQDLQVGRPPHTEVAGTDTRRECPSLFARLRTRDQPSGRRPQLQLRWRP